MEERIESEKARALRSRKRKIFALQHETLKMPDRQVRQLCIGMSSDIPPAQVLLCTPRGIPLYIAGPISQILRSVSTPLLHVPLHDLAPQLPLGIWKVGFDLPRLVLRKGVDSGRK